MKEPLEIKQRDLHTKGCIHFSHIRMEAKQVAEAYLMKQCGKGIEPAGFVGMVSTKCPRSRVKVTPEKKTDWKEIMRLLKEYHKVKLSSFSIEVTTYFSLIDLIFSTHRCIS
ncbi:hypothetical protein ACJ73_08701 [Blastomyces percursus]|uniref:Uncharacterized protein n=1 Tax=Blastomyces percursus TaxID=1658174 RepID=A0A1J9QEK6_9EURO|nr:hypothetical protein ACJ73_08701 [Blastomyces percursus]